MYKKTIFVFSFIAVFIILFSQVKALSLGAAPGVMEIGKLDRGKSYAVDFYLLTNSKKDMITTLGFREGKKSMYDKNVTGRYTFIPAEASEESIEDWIDFIRSKIVVSDMDSFQVRFPDGTIINANEKATFTLDVPEDAEPGYHSFEVVLTPKLSGGSGSGVSTIGVTRPVFIFQIPGKATRSGVIEGMAGSRTENKAEVDVLFRNTGTVTISARVSSLKVYNETGHYIGTYTGNYVKIPPKSTGILKVYWIDKNRNKQKTIKVEATVDYLTGEVTKEGMVTIPRTGVTTRILESKEDFPWWIIILIIGVILLYLYWKKR